MARKAAVLDRTAAMDSICAQIAEGTPLSVVCRQTGMPARRTVYDWLVEDKKFAARMDISRDLGADAIAEEALRIADTPMVGERSEKEGRKVKVFKEDMLGHRKLQVETRLKLLAKWHPAKYGDKITQELTGPGGAGLIVEIVRFGEKPEDA